MFPHLITLIHQETWNEIVYYYKEISGLTQVQLKIRQTERQMPSHCALSENRSLGAILTILWFINSANTKNWELAGWLSVSYYTGSVGRTIIRQDKTKDHGGTSCSSQPRPGQGWPGGTLGQFSLQLIGWHGARVKTIKTFSDESVICQAPVLWCLPTCLQCPVRAHNDIEMRY